MIERRSKRRAEGRAAHRKAEVIFADLGARLWPERTQRELARTGVTRSLDRQPTPTERRIAELERRGAHNKEIAGAVSSKCQDRGGEPVARVREARNPVTCRARGCLSHASRAWRLFVGTQNGHW